MVNVTFDDAGNFYNNAPDVEGNYSVYNLGDIAWVLTAAALVWIMIPGTSRSPIVALPYPVAQASVSSTRVY